MTETDRKGLAPRASESTPSTERVGSDRQTSKSTEAATSTPIDIHAYIGARLREAFDDVAKQPVPDRFLQLMRELDKR